MSNRAITDRVLLALAVLAALICAVRLRPPATVDPELRAELGHTLGLLGPDPHPVGSAAHDQARDRLFTELDDLGTHPRVQEATACGRRGRCARVANLIGRLGPAGGRPIAVVAHYDSVAAGPGAGDDGAGVAAVLAIARRYSRDPPPAPVDLVLTDGEELGLLGARALVAAHLLDDVAAVVNLEARGTHGPSLMFETTGPTASAASRFARTATRPFSSSLFDAVYQVLPNDTDLTVFRALDVPGFNFAFLQRPRDYHTPDDRVGELSVESAAHQMGNAAALVDSLVRDPPDAEGGDAVWFDVFGFRIVRFPQDWALPLVVLTLGGLGFGVRRTGARARSIGIGVGLGVLGLVVAGLVGTGLILAVHWDTVAKWHSLVWPTELALVGAGCAIGFGVPRWGPPDDPGVWFGGVLLFALVALGATLTLPGASFLWLVPAGLGAVLSPRPAIGAAVAAVAAVVVWSPVVGMLYESLGSPLGAAVTVAAAAASGGLGLALRDRSLGRHAALACGAIAAVGFLVGLVPTGESEPENVIVLGATTSTEGARVPPGASPGIDLPPPLADAELEADGVRVHLASTRGATTLGLSWSGSDVRATVDGVEATPMEHGDRSELWIFGVSDAGVDVELRPAPSSLSVQDETPGLPAGMDHPVGTHPFQSGDRTRAARTIDLPSR